MDLDVMRVEVDARLDALRRAWVDHAGTDEPARVGDVVTIDLAATVDGAPVDRGTARGVRHAVGSGHLLAGLDEALVGMAAGGSTTISSRLVGGPDAGTAVDLTITVTAVTRVTVPELDDAFATRVGAGTVEQLRDRIRDQVNADRRIEAARQQWDRLADSAAAPGEAVARESARIERALHRRLAAAGVGLADYLAAAGLDEGAFVDALAEEATVRVRHEVALDALAEAAGVAVADDELSVAVALGARRMGMTAEQFSGWLAEHGTARSSCSAAICAGPRRSACWSTPATRSTAGRGIPCGGRHPPAARPLSGGTPGVSGPPPRPPAGRGRSRRVPWPTRSAGRRPPEWGRLRSGR